MRCPTCSFSRGAIAPFALVGIFAFACVPAADALVVSSSGTATTTNTSSTDTVQYAWDRTVYLSAGTGVYLGCDGNGTYYILTAAHVSTDTGNTVSIASSSGTAYSYTIASSSSTILTNSDGSSADLKVVAITSADSSALSYLQSLGTTSIYTSSLSTTSSGTQGGPPNMNNSSTTLYVVGTGKASSTGSSYSTGTRTKTWGAFAIGDTYTNEKSTTTVANGSTYSTTCYMEVFSTSGNTVIACDQDSGSGVWVADSDSLALAGVVLYLAGGGGTTLNYCETDNSGYWATYYADLSQYYSQIAAILAVPEPSAFALLAGAGALALVAARRRRTRSRKVA